MLQRFIKIIKEEHLIAEGQQVLLAVSGGRDSVTLCHLVAAAKIPFSIAHCNFHLRPGDCDCDEAFVRHLADSYGVPCHIAEFDTEAYARNNGLSIEEAARKLRYSFFEQQRLANGYDLIATAHHRDDAIETFFINLLRGTGITGLHGIRMRNGNIVRPLLSFGREDIDAYIRRHNLDYVEDCTNSQTLYLRNRIRLQLLPLLRQITPSFDSIMQGNIGRIVEVEQIYLAAIDGARQNLLKPQSEGYTISIAELKKLSPLHTYLFELLRPYGFSSAVVAEIIIALDSQSGKRFYSPTHFVIKDREHLLILPCRETELNVEEYTIHESDLQHTLPVSIRFQITTATGQPIRLGLDEAWFDYSRVRFPLTLRHWRNGDRFIPFGMKGSRLVSDLFSDLKLSLPDKEAVWLLCDVSDAILWVVGLRASANASVTSSTEKILKVKYTQ